MTSKVTCIKCRISSSTYDPVLILPLNLGDPIPIDVWSPSIEDLLADWSLEEALDENNMFKCAGCRNTTKKLKRLEMSIAPPILVIQIKRFKRTATKEKGVKLQQHVRYTEDLQLKVTPIIGEHKVVSYQLRAIATHIGTTISGGHYTVVTKTGSGTADWIWYSDTQRVRISRKQALNQQAYLLFYEREDYADAKVTQVQTEPLQPTDSLTTHRKNVLGNLLENQKFLDYRDDTVYLKTLVKHQAIKLTHTHMVKLAKNHLKLLGGTTTDDDATEDEAPAKATDTNENKGPVIIATVENPTLSLRKPELPADRSPKRRKTMIPSKVADSANSKPEQRLKQPEEPDAVPEDAEDIEDTDMSEVQEVEEKNQTKDTNSDTNWPTSATNLPKGSLKARWHMDNTIEKPKNQLDEVPEKGILDTETHANEAAKQLMIGLSKKLY